MSQGPIPTGMAGAASSTSTDAETLREIAYHFPELRPVVAANPSAYPGLLTWLGELGDPAVDAALAARGIVPASASTATPPAFSPGAVDTTATWQGSAQGSHDGRWAGPTSGTEFIAEGLDRTPQPEEETPKRSSTGLRVLLVVLLVVAALLLTLVVLIFRGVFDAPDTGTSTAGTSQSPTPTAQTSTGFSPSSSPSGSDSPTPSASVTAYPAPTGAVQTTTFTAPSGNIACSLDGDTATCTIFSSDYASRDYGTCGQTTTLTADASSAGLGCGTTIPDGSTPLAYGSAATSGTVACVSTEQGISCWNTISGQAFALARGGWMTGTSGEITPQEFTWR